MVEERISRTIEVMQPASRDPASVHMWYPDMFGYRGGIQVYSSFLLQACESLYPNLCYQVFVKNDKADGTQRTNGSSTQFHFAGRWPTSLRTPAFAFQIILLGMQQRPRLVIASHLHFAVAAYWLKRLTGVPYWSVAHGVEAWNITSLTTQRALRGADRILAVSSFTRDRLLKEQKLNPCNVSLLPNTVDSTRFAIGPKPEQLLRRYRLHANQPIILTVARLQSSERYKGYDSILRALPQISKSIPNVHYVLVGKGDDKDRVRQLVGNLGLQGRVTLAGYVPDSELNNYYNLCDVFAMPSKSEGFGIVYLEALACGRPVLAGNKDGSSDALCRGELGVLVDPDDIDLIAHTLTRILQRSYPHPLIYYPDALRHRVIQTYGFERFRETLREYLDPIFASAGHSHSTPTSQRN